MVVVGVDAHKRTHTLVAADDVGRELASKTVAATPEGHLEAVEWAARWPERKFALEDCRHVTRRLERDLLAAGEAVVRVPTRLMAGERRGGRERGKSDPIDALAVARAALREPNLPVAHLDGETRELRLLVDHREDLVRERTRIQSRLRWHLHELFPGLVIRPKGLRCFKVLDELDVRLANMDGTVAEIARELVARTRSSLRARTILNGRSPRSSVVSHQRCSRLAGCGPLSAAKIVGETAGAGRFRSKRRVRALERHRPNPGVVRESRPSTTQPRWQPPGQRRATSHRDHSMAWHRPLRPRVCRTAHRLRQQQDRSAAPPSPTAVRRSVPPTPRRRNNNKPPHDPPTSSMIQKNLT